MGIGDLLGTASPGVAIQGFSTSAVVIWMTVILGVLIIGGAVMFTLWFYFIYFDKKIMVIEQLGRRGFTVKFDRARLMKKKAEDGIRHLKMFWAKKEIQPPDMRVYGLNRRRPFLILSKCGEDYNAAGVTFNSPANINLQTEFNRRLIWLNERKRIHEKFDPKGLWDKYGAAIVIVGTLVICFLIIVVSFQQQAEIVGASTAAADALRTSVDRLVDLMR